MSAAVITYPEENPDALELEEVLLKGCQFMGADPFPPPWGVRSPARNSGPVESIPTQAEYGELAEKILPGLGEGLRALNGLSGPGGPTFYAAGFSAALPFAAACQNGPPRTAFPVIEVYAVGGGEETESLALLGLLRGRGGAPQAPLRGAGGARRAAILEGAFRGGLLEALFKAHEPPSGQAPHSAFVQVVPGCVTAGAYSVEGGQLFELRLVLRPYPSLRALFRELRVPFFRAAFDGSRAFLSGLAAHCLLARRLAFGPPPTPPEDLAAGLSFLQNSEYSAVSRDEDLARDGGGDDWLFAEGFRLCLSLVDPRRGFRPLLEPPPGRPLYSDASLSYSLEIAAGLVDSVRDEAGVSKEVSARAAAFAALFGLGGGPGLLRAGRPHAAAPPRLDGLRVALGGEPGDTAALLATARALMSGAAGRPSYEKMFRSLGGGPRAPPGPAGRWPGSGAVWTQIRAALARFPGGAAPALGAALAAEAAEKGAAVEYWAPGAPEAPEPPRPFPPPPARNSECSLCCGPLPGDDGDPRKFVAACGHAFHRKEEECGGILAWFEGHGTCPVCRKPLTVRGGKPPRPPSPPLPGPLRQLLESTRLADLLQRRAGAGGEPPGGGPPGGAGIQLLRMEFDLNDDGSVSDFRVRPVPEEDPRSS